MSADPASRFRLALDLFDTGEAMMRQRIRRLHPEWTSVQIESRLMRWLHERPGAEDGDAAGRPVAFATRER